MKYFVKQLPTEYNDFYFDMLKDDITQNIYNDVFIYGNKNYTGINAELIKVIIDNLFNYSDYDLQVYCKNNLCNLIIDELKSFKKINLRQAISISKIIKEYKNQNRHENICKVLSIIFNKTFNYNCMRGYSQSDYQFIYFSDTVDRKYIDYIEAVYFGTGLEIIIHDGENIPTNADEIDGYTEYLACNMDVKKEIANLLNCNADDIVYYEITNEYKITKYEYTAR